MWDRMHGVGAIHERVPQFFGTALHFYRDSLGVRAIPQNPFMDPRKVRLVHKILNRSRSSAVPRDGTHEIVAVVAIVELGTLRNGRGRLIETHPNQPVPFLALISRHASLVGNRPVGADSGNASADSAAVIVPPVISAYDAIAFHPAQRKRGAAMDTEVLQAGHADRKSTRLNSSHLGISYAVFC